ncbi:MAG: hypothetical protein ILA11_10895 [Butyrivibrio sp.]|nr:hypothetical protein [Butyrivibrio sp.]
MRENKEQKWDVVYPLEDVGTKKKEKFKFDELEAIDLQLSKLAERLNEPILQNSDEYRKLREEFEALTELKNKALESRARRSWLRWALGLGIGVGLPVFASRITAREAWKKGQDLEIADGKVYNLSQKLLSLVSFKNDDPNDWKDRNKKK